MTRLTLHVFGLDKYDKNFRDDLKGTQRRYSTMMDFAQAQQSIDPGICLSVQGSFARVQQTKANKMSSSPVVSTL